MTRFLACSCFLCCLTACTTGANPDYDPRWSVNDTWWVKTSFSLPTVWPPDGESFTNRTVCYKYLVTATDVGKHLATVHVEATGETDFAVSQFDLTFDTTEMALSKVEEAGEMASLVMVNPYGKESWLMPEHIAMERIILDFPRIPTMSTNVTRELSRAPTPGTHPAGIIGRRAQDETGGFVQQAVFTTNCVLLSLSRPYYDETTNTVTFVWQKGQKWWQSATIKYGTNIAVSAVLCTTPTIPGPP